MEYRRLGSCGLQTSALSLGAWSTIGERLDLQESKELLQCAFELGINFFDNADVYNDGQSEIILGQLLRYFNWPREEYLVSSKVFFGLNNSQKPNTYGLSRKHIFEACHASLSRLGIEYLDIYFCHRPDVNTPLLETVQAMSDLIHQGKIFYWGTSEWQVPQLLEIFKLVKHDNYLIAPVTEQSQYNLFTRHRIEKELIDLNAKHGLGLTVWSPLCSGLLAGRYNQGVMANSRLALKGYEASRKEVMGDDEAQRIFIINQLNNYAIKELNTSMAELALAWCIRNEAISTAIMGASSPLQIVQNYKCLALSKKLDAEILSHIDKIILNAPVESTTNDYCRI